MIIKGWINHWFSLTSWPREVSSPIYQNVKVDWGTLIPYESGQPVKGVMKLTLFDQLGVTLPETNIFAPKNGWLEYDPFLLGRLIFRCKNISFREGIWVGEGGGGRVDPVITPRLTPRRHSTLLLGASSPSPVKDATTGGEYIYIWYMVLQGYNHTAK